MHSSPPQGYSFRRRRRAWVLLLLALLMSFACVFTSTWLAISRPPGRLAAAPLLAMSQADYGDLPDESRWFAPLRPEVGAEAVMDAGWLRITSTAAAGGQPMAVVFLPPTPTPTAIPTRAASPLGQTPTRAGTPTPTPGLALSPSRTPGPTGTATSPSTATRALFGTSSALPPTATPASTPTQATFPPTATAQPPLGTPTPMPPPPDTPERPATSTPVPPTPTYTATPTNTRTPANRPPLAVDDPATTGEDAPATIHVTANDSDPDMNLDVTSVTTVTSPLSGTLSIAAGGYIIYTPQVDLNGVDVFDYRVCDTGLPVLCDTAAVTVIIAPVNDPPLANDDLANTSPGSPVAIAVLANDGDIDGNLDPASAAVVTSPSSGTLSWGAPGVITYTPGITFTGTDSFTYQVCDTGAPVLCGLAGVTVAIDNLALGRPAQASSYHNANHNSDKAVDGDIDTMWRTALDSSLPSEWMVVDLGSNIAVSQVVLRWDNAFATSYTVQVSPDNVAWTSVFTTTSGDGGMDTIAFSPTPARFVKMESTAWSGDPWRIWLSEFEIYP